MTEDLEELYSDMAEYVKIYSNTKGFNPRDVAYNLPQHVGNFESQGLKLWNEIIRYHLINEIKSVGNVEELRMGDLYGAGDVRDLHGKISKEVTSRIEE